MPIRKFDRVAPSSHKTITRRLFRIPVCEPLKYSPGHVQCPECKGYIPGKCYTCNGDKEIPYREYLVWGRAPGCTYPWKLGDAFVERAIARAIKFGKSEILKNHGVPVETKTIYPSPSRTGPRPRVNRVLPIKKS